MKAWHWAQGGGAGCRALRDDDGAVLGVGLAACALSLHESDNAERAEHGGRPRKKEAAEGHAGTKGPGDFRYLFLIASSAQ